MLKILARCAIAVFVFLVLPTLARAEASMRLAVISSPQTLAPGAVSAVMTLELQDLQGNKINASSTLHIALISTSQSGQFYSSPASGPCGSTISPASLTLSTGTSHKSFCYSDVTEGNFTIATQADSADVAAGSQEIVITSAPQLSPPPTPTPTTGSESPTPTPTPVSTSTKEQISTSTMVKIYRFMPNPAGDDSGKEWVEVKNTGDATVTLTGWFLDDKNTGGGPAGDAYVLSGNILPNEVLHLLLPVGSFALNNSGGDEINLYWADKTLADKAVYSPTADDDDIFELRDGLWQPPAKPASSGGGGGGSVSTVTTCQTSDFKLNEIFPNPQGADSGQEWVEIFNNSLATSSLEGCYLATGDGDAWTSGTWSIPKNYLVGPKGVLGIILPKDIFDLPNTAGRVKLFSPQKQLIDSISYKDAPENLAYARQADGKWQWSVPTYNVPNDQVPPLWPIYISEVLPKPSGDDEEFVELYNPATSTLDISGAVLQIGSRKKVFPDGSKIRAQSFLVVSEDDLPTRLSNSGQTIKLFDPYNRQVSEAVYSKAESGLAYASSDGKTYAWTNLPTPGEGNELVLAAALADMGGMADSEKPSSVAKTTPGLTRAQATSLINSNKQLKEQIAALQMSLNELKASLEPRVAEAASISNPVPEETEKVNEAVNTSNIFVWLISVALAGVGIFLGFKLVKK